MSRSIQQTWLATGLVLGIWTLAYADKPVQSPAERYRALNQQYQDGTAAFNRALGAATTPEERRKAFALIPDRQAFARKFLELAEQFPLDPIVVFALLRASGLDPEGAFAVRANARLLKDHMASDRLDALCLNLRFEADGDKGLRQVLAQSPHRVVRGQACLSLGLWLKSRGDEGDVPAQREAEQLFGRVATEYADVTSAGQLLAPQAEEQLQDLRTFGVGRPAPEIEGEDADGRPMKLSEYRSKVVLLTFWASRCEPCMRLVAFEKDRADRYAGKPFALVGVNADGDRGTQKNVERAKKITWRSWWGGPGQGQGPIPQAWKVRGWPTVYVLDTKGVIRYRSEGADETKLGAAIEQLVRETDAARGK